MNKLGKITYKSKDGTSKFVYGYKISDYHAARILEYISQIPHSTTQPARDAKGRFVKRELL